MNRVQALFIEAGHGKMWYGAADPGAVGSFGGQRITEREITRNIARKVLNILTQKMAEYEGYPTLVQGVGIESEASVLSKVLYMNRVIKNNGKDPNYCYAISIHVDSNSNTPGTMGYYQNKRPRGGDMLGTILQRMYAYFPNNPIKEHGVKLASKSRFGLKLYINTTACSNILIEMGHIGYQPAKENFIITDDRMAEAIANGVLTYFKDMYLIY